MCDASLQHPGALLKANDSGVPDINIDSFAIRATVNFDGTIVPECDVTAILRFNSTDVSGDVKSNVELAQPAWSTPKVLTPALVRQGIDSFFVRLMRLNGMSWSDRGRCPRWRTSRAIASRGTAWSSATTWSRRNWS